MPMSKKDFIALADTVRAFRETNAGREMDDISFGVLLQHLANFCQSENPAFKRSRWLDYVAGECGPSGGAIPTPKTTPTGEYLKGGQK